jgi:hypothetical protein
MFACVTKSGAFSVLTVAFSEDVPALATVSFKRIENVEKCKFFGLRKQRAVVAYDGDTLTLMSHRIWIHRKIDLYEKLTFSEHIAVTGFSTISRLTVSPTALGFAAFADLPERVTSFASSRRFGIAAVACQDGMLRIRSFHKGVKIATVSIGAEVAQRMLITKKWGFIVVKTDRTILVFNLHGLFVNKSTNDATIKSWTSFRSSDGFDFVAYDDGLGKLWYFEAIEPAKLVAIDIGTTVSSMCYHWRSDRFLVLLNDGTIQFVPVFSR